jgi:hypothetical protein
MKTVSHAKISSVKPTSTVQYVTIATYDSTDDTTCSSSSQTAALVYGTNLCATFSSGSGSTQLVYTASTTDDGGVLSAVEYSDTACSTQTNSIDLYTITDMTCQSGMLMYSVSTTYSLPDTDGYAAEYFATSSECSADTPYEAAWVSTGLVDDDALALDDAFFISCFSTTAGVSEYGAVNAYITEQCTGSGCPGGSSSSSSKSCFAGSETVTMESGEVKAISEVARGDRVLAADANGNTKFSTVVAVPHAANNDAAVFTHITAASGADIKMTEDHLLMVSPACSGSAELMAASSVEAGMCVMTTKAMEKVASVESVNGNGLYTIVTEEEMVVVNGFVASPFATNHAAANAFYNVVRMLPASFLDISIVKRATEIFGSMAASF